MIIGKDIDLVIICPSYNHGKYIEKAIQGVLEQKTQYTYQMVIIDDASTDGAQEIIKKYQEKHPDKIIAILHKKNHGTGKDSLFATNISIVSKYISYLESDDYWCDALKIQKQLDFLSANPDYISVCHATEILHENNPQKNTIIKPSINEWSIDEMLSGQHYLYCHTSSYIRKNIFKEILPPRLKVSKDYRGDTIINYAYAESGKTKYLDSVMSVYRITMKGSWSQNSDKKQDLLNLKLYDTINEFTNHAYSDQLMRQKRQGHEIFRAKYSKAYKAYLYFRRLRETAIDKALLRKVLSLVHPRKLCLWLNRNT